MPSASLPTHQAAIYRDDRSRHVIRQVGRQELNDFGAVLNGSEPSQSYQLGPITVALAAAGNDGLHDPSGRDHTGGDAVRGDPERPEILRQIPGVMGDSRLRRPVMSVAAIGGGCDPATELTVMILPERCCFMIGATALHE